MEKFVVLLRELDAELKFGLQKGAVNYNPICKKLARLCRYGKFEVESQSELGPLMRSCMDSLKILLQSTEYQKHGHRLPLVDWLLSKYQSVLPQKLEPTHRNLLVQIMHRNEESPMSAISDFLPIDADELQILQTGRVENFFGDLRNSSVVLQNPSCVCCSQVFIRNFQVTNKNPFLPVVVQLTAESGFDQITLENTLTAVCNEGGGVVIIGVHRRNGESVIAGIRFSSWEEVTARETEIRMAVSSIRPDCPFLIERVLVHTNYVNPKNIGQENMRICFRVAVFPKQSAKISYSETRNKNNHRIYEVFRLDQQQHPYKVVSSPLKNQLLEKCESVYSMMHQKYRQHRQKTNSHSHKNICCFRPHPYYSSFFDKYWQEGHSAEQQGEMEEMDEEQEEQERKKKQNLSLEDEPKFKYKNVSLLVIRHKESERIINEFQKALNSKKQVFELKKCFESSFKEAARSVWVISHEVNFIVLKNLYKCFQVTGHLKSNCLVMMPVFKTLQIQNNPYSINLPHITTKFLKKYPKLYTAETKNLSGPDPTKKPKTVTYLHFSTDNEAIYAYMIFEELGLKPYFTKDGNNSVMA